MTFMKSIGLAVFAICLTLRLASAGDDASGPIHYSVDLSQPFTTYVMSERDKEWSRSLVGNLKYNGPVVHFVRTSLPLLVDKAPVNGQIYQALEKPDILYVLKSDTMLELNQQWPYNPGVLGFSMHAPRSRHFIVALNFFSTGVPLLSSSPVQKGVVTWNGHLINRLQ